MDRSQAEFVQQLLAVQSRLRVFVRVLVPDRAAADDLVQRTNVRLCEKASDFQAGSDFAAWACQFAYFEVLSYRQRRAREREKLVFDDDQLEQIAAAAVEAGGAADDQLVALRECLRSLPAAQRDLLHRRYSLAQPFAEIARQLSRPAGSLRQTLLRVRLALLQCIQGRLGEGSGHG